MAEQPINPITPANNQREAAAASTAAIFTASDRKIIEERTGGEEMRSRGFLDVLKNKPLVPEVENQETTVQEPQKNAEATISRFDQHRRILKHSPITHRKDQVILSGQLPVENREEAPPATVTGENKEESLPPPLPPALISRLRDLHLKRLLSESREEFEKLSAEIRSISLATAKPEAHAWLEEQFKHLTIEAATYKLGVLRSLQQMEPNENRAKDILWLEEELKKLS